MQEDAQGMAGGDQLVALVSAGDGGYRAHQHQPADEAGTWSMLGRRASYTGGGGSIARAPMHTIQRMRKDLGMSLAQIAQGQGVSESLVRRVLMVEDVEAIAFKNGWDQVDCEKRDRRAPLPLHPLFQRQGRIASVDLGLGEPFSLGGQAQKIMDTNLDTDVHVS